MTETRARSSRAQESVTSMIGANPLGPEHRKRRLEVHARIAGPDRQRVRLGRRHPGLVGAVDEQAPNPLERDPPDQLLDVDAAVAQRAALPVGLRDRGVS